MLPGGFLQGVLTRSASERRAFVGMVCGLRLYLYLWLFTRISFTWYVVLGSIVTFVVGYASSRPKRLPEPALLRNGNADSSVDD